MARDENSFMDRLNARIYAVLFLTTFCGLVYLLSVSVYWAVQDSWVAPISLSSDNDKVIQTYSRVSKDIERLNALQARLPVIEELIKGKQPLLQQMQELQEKLNGVLNFVISDNKGSRDSLAENIKISMEQEKIAQKTRKAQLDSIDQQEKLLMQSKESQKKAIQEALGDFKAGLISKSDYEKQLLGLRQIEYQETENRKKRVELETQIQIQNSESQKKLMEYELKQKRLNVNLDSNISKGGDRSPAGKKEKKGGEEISPQLVDFESRYIKVSGDILSLQEDIRTLENEYKLSKESLETLQQTIEKAKAGPYYRSFTEKAEIAFIPYSQLEGVKAGDSVMHCILGMFFCEKVGEVKNVIPGEVNEEDPWGDPSRGQYLELKLSDPSAITRKILRIRKS